MGATVTPIHKVSVTMSNYRLDQRGGNRVGTFSMNIHLMPNAEGEKKNTGTVSLNFCALINGENGYWIAGPNTRGKRQQNVHLGWIGDDVQAKLLDQVVSHFDELRAQAPDVEDVVPF